MRQIDVFSHKHTLTSGDIVIGECRQMEIYSRIKMADFPEIDLIEYIFSWSCTSSDKIPHWRK